MTPMFIIRINQLENGQVNAFIQSLSETKAKRVQAPNMKLLMATVSKEVRKRNLLLKRFPKPEPKTILAPNEAQILWTPNGH